MKFYFCGTVGDGTEDDPFMPVVHGFCSEYVAVDARPNPLLGGYMLVKCEITEEKHQELMQENSVIHMDTKDLAMDSKVGEIADRSELKAQLNSMGVDISALTSQSTIQNVFSATVDHLLSVQNNDH